MSGQQPDLVEIKLLLAERSEEFGEFLFGIPTGREGNGIRWGARQGQSLVTRGPKRGLFKDHDSGAKGTLLDAIMLRHSCALPQAIRVAKSWLGLSEDWTAPPITDAVRIERERKRARQQAEQDRDIERRITWARALAGEAEPVAGTLGERYLVETRHIPKPAKGWPDCVRFHARSRSLLVVSTTPGGEVQAIQLVFLDNDARKLSQDELVARDLPLTGKKTFGLCPGSVVRLPGAADGPLLAGEGPETCLSAWVATGHETWITLSRLLPAAEFPTGRGLAWLTDDDAEHSPRAQSIQRALGGWTRAGLHVVPVTPWETRRFNKNDFNDLIRESGPEAVRARIESALNPEPPAPPPSRMPVEQAREILDRVVEKFLNDAPSFDAGIAEAEGRPASACAVKVDLGVGKTAIALRYSASVLAAMRARGDRRKFVLGVPTHKLGEELARQFEALPDARACGLKAAVWRGREAPDPDERPIDGEGTDRPSMCLNMPAVKDAMACALPVQTSVCRKKPKGRDAIECPFFRFCHYQRQHDLARVADLVIVAHEMVFTSKPAVFGEIAALIVDESPWQDGLRGTDGDHTALSLDSLDTANLPPGMQELWWARVRVMDALRAHPDGPITREKMLAVPLTASEAHAARRAEFERLVDPGMHPRMTEEQRAEARRAAAGNKTILRMADFWTAMEALLADGGPEASGWAGLATIDDEHGIRRVLRLKGRKPVREGWKVPTLLMDATMDVNLLRYYWPQIALAADIAVDAPHQSVAQVTDRAFGKSMLEPILDLPDPADTSAQAKRLRDEAQRRANRLRDVHAILGRATREHAPHKSLAIVQQCVEAALPHIGPLPVQLAVAHHNDVAGRDEWRDVRFMALVGRTVPGPMVVERMAEALTGRAVKPLGHGRWYDRVDALREIIQPDGTTRFETAAADRHPDPDAEAVRWQICEGGALQGIGRGRGVNRTAENPVDVLLMTSLVLPIPIHETLTAAALAAGPDDMMLGAGGVAYENARHAATAYPQLWPSWKAAAKALERARSATFPNKDLSIGECRTPPGLREVLFQLKRAGAKPTSARFDPDLVPDIETRLTEKLGPLAWCRVGEPTEPTDPPRRPSREEVDKRIAELMGSAAAFDLDVGFDRDWRPFSLFDEIPIEPDDAWHPGRTCPWSEDGPDFDWPLRMGALCPGGYGAGRAYLSSPPTGPP